MCVYTPEIQHRYQEWSYSKRRYIFQTIILGIPLGFQGCISLLLKLLQKPSFFGVSILVFPPSPTYIPPLVIHVGCYGALPEGHQVIHKCEDFGTPPKKITVVPTLEKMCPANKKKMNGGFLVDDSFLFN